MIIFQFYILNILIVILHISMFYFWCIWLYSISFVISNFILNILVFILSISKIYSYIALNLKNWHFKRCQFIMHSMIYSEISFTLYFSSSYFIQCGKWREYEERETISFITLYSNYEYNQFLSTLVIYMHLYTTTMFTVNFFLSSIKKDAHFFHS